MSPDEPTALLHPVICTAYHNARVAKPARIHAADEPVPLPTLPDGEPRGDG